MEKITKKEEFLKGITNFKYYLLFLKRGNLLIFFGYILFITLAYVCNIGINYILGGWS